MSKLLLEVTNATYTVAHRSHPLFENINYQLLDKTYFLVGDNGVGKSSFLALLSKPSSMVKHLGRVGFLKQELDSFNGSVAEKLELASKLQALTNIEQGSVSQPDFDVLGDDWDIKSVIEKQLSTYDLPTNLLDKSYAALSGGMRTRLNLLLLERKACDFYLLDEPSNHLDKKGRLFLKQWIDERPHCLIVTHDLSLLEDSSNILTLTPKGLHYYKGTWQGYLEAKKTRQTEIQLQIEQSEKQLKQAKSAKQKNAEVLQSKQNKAHKSRASTNQSKIILDKNKSQSEATSARLTSASDKRIIEAQRSQAQAQEALSLLDIQCFHVSPICQSAKKNLLMQDIILPYGQNTPISLQLAHGKRLWISGDNGSGKSTLLKIILGSQEPISGKMDKPLSIAMLDQHFSFLEQNETALDNFTRLAPDLGDQSIYRMVLAQLRLRREAALQKVSTLSGGECLKLALACLFSGKFSPALLLLDEPDNHLDLSTKELLINALNTYEGTLIVISHDEKFVEKLRIDETLYL